MSDLTEPLAEVWMYPLRKGDKLGSVQWVEFHLNDFLTSTFVTHAQASGRTDDVFRALLLWSECYRQDPVGTLPDDDVVLAFLARMPLEAWAAARDHILHGWEPCQVETPKGYVQRLGHHLIAEISERTYRRYVGKAAARESHGLAVRKNRVRKKLVELKLTRMSESDAVVTAIVQHLDAGQLWITDDSVRQAAEMFQAPVRLVHESGRSGAE